MDDTPYSHAQAGICMYTWKQRDHVLTAQREQKEQLEVGQVIKTPKPIHSETLPSARLNFLKCHCLPEQHHQQRTKCSNT